jgi:N-acyl-L-homoserine lactone synthetase
MKPLGEAFIQGFAKSMIKHPQAHWIQFRNIKTPEEWLQLGAFRKRGYQARKPYMVAELHDDGKDSFDAHGLVYSAWWQDEMVASVRLCPHPFESESLMSRVQLESLLGENYQANYLEWTRLLISEKINMPYLLNALIIYAGMQTLATSHYQHYFGYSSLLVRRLFRQFKLSNDNLGFTIPHRGNHQYVLFKGNFLEDFHYLMTSQESQEIYL